MKIHEGTDRDGDPWEAKAADGAVSLKIYMGKKRLASAHDYTPEQARALAEILVALADWLADD